MRVLADYRLVLSLTSASAMGLRGLHLWPWPADDSSQALIHERHPDMYAGFKYAYTTLSFSSPLILFSLALFTVCTSLARAGTVACRSSRCPP